MPQSPSPTVSFKIPVKNDSQQITGYKTVHVVVGKPGSKDEGSFSIIFGPLVIVFVIAATIIFLSSKIKPGGKIDQLLSKVDGSSNVSD
jgi:hypothetical protein